MALRLLDGRYRCAVCGAVLDVPTDKEPKYAVKAASGQPNIRVLVIDGVEVHRCALPSDEG